MRRIHAPTLIELATNTLKNEIQPAKSLDGSQRYALAMAISALRIARAEVISEPDAAQWALLDSIYDDGEGSMKQLARDIRDKTINDETHPNLRQRLEKLLIAELEVRNPAALKGRNADSGTPN